MFWYHLVAQAEQPSGMLKFINDVARTPISQVVIFLAALTVLRLICYPYLSQTRVRYRTRSYYFVRGTSDVLDAIIYAGIFVFLVIRPFVGQTFYVPTGSMLNTIQLKDFIVANKYSYRFTDPQRGDIVVFWPPVWGFLGPDHSIPYIKRCIGIPGDTIEVKEGVLYRNGEKLEERYLREPLMDYDFRLVEYKGEPMPLIIMNGYPNYTRLTAEKYRVDPGDYALMAKLMHQPLMKIPHGYYFMSGDNRNGSYDGRSWGLVPRANIIAKSEFVWLPLNRIGRTQ